MALTAQDKASTTQTAEGTQTAGGTAPGTPEKKETTFALAFGTLGIVYGDIGTSPLYAVRESLIHSRAIGMPDQAVIGTISLVIWALLFTVTAKYVVFLLHADNKGEGGTLPLMTLAQTAFGRRTALIFFLGVVGAALFSGDAIITPAISVLSAVEGLNVATPAFEPYVLPLTVLILAALFAVQSHGTARVASFFAPVTALFFIVIGGLGAMHIPDAPRILWAFDPLEGLRFLFGHGLLGFAVLGSVFLAVTGAETLYADLGHFGRRPIQLAWLCFVLPALALNYLGQGALVLANNAAVQNPFYLLAPSWALLPLVVLATMATVIASQAVITGSFSIVRQAIQLGLLPRMEIQHKSETQEGQIFMPYVNRTLLIGVLLLVFTFRTSSALGNAYGVAVTGTMVVTTSLAFIIVWKKWMWPLWASIGFIAIFLTMDCVFLAANLMRVVEGGWVPLLLAMGAMVVMWTFVRGNEFLLQKMRRDSIPLQELIQMLEKSKPTRVPGTAIFLTNQPEVAPSALMHNLKHNKVLHEHVWIMSVRTESIPRVPLANRYEVEQLSEDFTRITLHYGFMESPRVPPALALLRKCGLKFDIMTTSFFLGRRTIKASPTSGMPHWQDKLFVSLSKQATNATDFFAIPSDRVVELGAQVTV